MVERGTYWRQWGLHEDPFRTVHPLDGGDNWFWQPLFPIKKSDMVVVSGVTGVGKSLYAAQYKLESNYETSWLFATKGMQPNNLLKAIVQRFVLDVRLDLVTIEAKKNAFIHVINNSERFFLLVIDDAHNLPNETLVFLAEALKEINSNQLKLVLVGLPILGDRIKVLIDNGGYSITTDTIVVSPMSKEQVKKYLSHILGLEGLDHAQLNDTVVSRIYELSSGVARDVNRVAAVHMRDLLLEQKKSHDMQQRSTNDTIGSRMSPQIVILFYALVACLCLCAAYSSQRVWSYFSDRQSVGQKKSLPDLFLQNHDKKSKLGNKDMVVLNDQSLQQKLINQKEEVSRLSSQDFDENLESGNKGIVALNDQSLQQQKLAKTTTLLTQVAEMAREEEDHVRQSDAPLVVASDQVTEHSQKIIAEQALSQHKIQEKVASDTRELMQQEGYIVQAAATKSMKEVELWVELFSHEGLRIVLAERNQDPWYLLLIGPVGNYQSAKQTLTNLSALHKVNKPWIRSLKQLHHDIVVYKEHSQNNDFALI